MDKLDFIDLMKGPAEEDACSWHGSFTHIPPEPFGKRSTASANNFNQKRFKGKFEENLSKHAGRVTHRAKYEMARFRLQDEKRKSNKPTSNVVALSPLDYVMKNSPTARFGFPNEARVWAPNHNPPTRQYISETAFEHMSDITRKAMRTVPEYTIKNRLKTIMDVEGGGPEFMPDHEVDKRANLSKARNFMGTKRTGGSSIPTFGVRHYDPELRARNDKKDWPVSDPPYMNGCIYPWPEGDELKHQMERNPGKFPGAALLGRLQYDPKELADEERKDWPLPDVPPDLEHSPSARLLGKLSYDPKAIHDRDTPFPLYNPAPLSTGAVPCMSSTSHSSPIHWDLEIYNKAMKKVERAQPGNPRNAEARRRQLLREKLESEAGMPQDMEGRIIDRDEMMRIKHNDEDIMLQRKRKLVKKLKRTREVAPIRAKEELKRSQRSKVEKMEEKVHQQRRDTDARREAERKKKQDRISVHRAAVREKRALKAKRAAEAEEEAKERRERLLSLSAHI